MKKSFFFRMLLLTGAVLLVTFSCKKQNDDSNPDGSDNLIFLSQVTVLQENASKNYASWTQSMDSLAAVIKLEQFLKDDPAVSSVSLNSQGISIQYTNGMRGGILLNPQDQPGNDTLFNKSGLKNPSTGFNAKSLVNNKKAIFLNPHYTDRKLYSDRIISHYNECLPKVGFSLQTVYKNAEASVDHFTELSGYGIIHVYTHGWAWPNDQNIEKVYLLSGEAVNDVTSKKYEEEIKNGDIMILRTTENKYCLSSAFISSHNDFSKDTVLFFGGFCYSYLGQWKQITQHFAKGAYIGFDWAVLTDWNAGWANALMDSLCDTLVHPPFNPEKWFLGSALPKSYWYEPANRTVSIQYLGDASLTLWKNSGAMRTSPVTVITQTTAQCGGSVDSDGGNPILAKGVCWSSSAIPTISDNKTVDGTGNDAFVSGITGLTANTLYYVRAYATNSSGTFYGAAVSFSTLQTIQPPIVTTSVITGIMQTQAECGGNVTSDGGAGVSARGVCWSTSQNPTVSNSKTNEGPGTGAYTSIITGLAANTLYYVRSYATNSAGTSYGNEVSFTTLQNLTTASVTTASVSNITQNSASCGGNVTSEGGATVTEKGICWSMAQNPGISDNKSICGIGAGSFSGNISGLSPNTIYYVRAFATNNYGTVYGNQVSFTTSSITYSIGQSFGGGIIFYIDGTGQHGLISAPTDQSIGSPWGCSGVTLGGTSREIGTGQANTTIIVGSCSETGIAARICNDLVLNGYSDWFLPSKYELYEMFLQKNSIGGFADAKYYSSSEDGSCCAWWQRFNTYGGASSDYKYVNYYVRAVRAF